jgi:anti-anti-sigma factor
MSGRSDPCPICGGTVPPSNHAFSVDEDAISPTFPAWRRGDSPTPEGLRLAERTAALDREYRTSYLRLVAATDSARQAGSLPQAKLLLDDCEPRPGFPDLREWEWHFLKRQCRPQWFSVPPPTRTVKGLNSPAFSPAGHRLISTSLDGTVRVWDGRPQRNAASGERALDRPARVRDNGAGGPPAMKIFLNYRRNDNAHATDRLFDRLAAEFGRDNIFYDVSSVPIGVNWRKYITDRVSQCDVFVATVGDSWLEELRRREGTNDMVRFEIESALKRGVPIVPVQVGTTPIPARESLPADIADFADWNGTLLRPGLDFTGDMQRLMERLKEMARALTQSAPATPAAPGTPAPACFQEVRRVGAVTVVVLRSSILDEDGSRALYDGLKTLIDGGASRLVLNLSRVEHLSSVGLQPLLSAYRRLRLASGELRICAAQPAIRELFRMIRFDRILGLDDTEEAAIAAIQAEGGKG